MLSVLRTTWPLLLGVMLLMVGNGMQGTLLGVRGAIEGIPTNRMALVMAGYFGGFLLGAVMPRGALTHKLREQLRHFVVVFLLPMFFTFSGLNTKLDLLADPALLGVAAVLLTVSILAKFGACWAAARR